MFRSDCFGEETTWLKRLPASTQASILWSADYETGDLSQWLRSHARQPGSGVFNSGGQDAIAQAQNRVVHSGRWALEAAIRNAYRAANGPRAVRMMVWTDRPWDEGGRHFPSRAYYSTWLNVPHAYDPAKRQPWNPGDGGWWNVMQFKSEDARRESQPMWVLNVSRTPSGELSLYLHSPVNRPSSYVPQQSRSFPIDTWVHVEVLYVSATDHRGEIAVFLNGERIIEVHSVVTSLGGRTGLDVHPIWGIGNYTDHIAGDPDGPGQATIYFDDTAVATLPLNKYIDSAVPNSVGIPNHR
jgi:hypothetical protein